MRWEQFDWLIEAALEEDMAREDVTTAALIDPLCTCRAEVVAKQEGVICGLPLAGRTARLLDAALELDVSVPDGTPVQAGTMVARLSGPAASLLSVERTMLNFVQRLSGTATLTRRFVDRVAGTGVRILDTRKTTPGWRVLEKYAVRCGGGENHRMGLNDQVLIKDNHLRLRASPRGTAWSVAGAIEAVRRTAGELKVEVEVHSLQQLLEALSAGADIIMLDNMTPDQVRVAVETKRACGAKTPSVEEALLEASGTISLDNVRAYAEMGVDLISIGALTHSAPALDISLDMF